MGENRTVVRVIRGDREGAKGEFNSPLAHQWSEELRGPRVSELLLIPARAHRSGPEHVAVPDLHGRDGPPD